jgi:arylsulfatase A-like enzyme
VLASITAGWLLVSAPRVRGVPIGPVLGVLAGLAIAVANHLVLILDYPGFHFTFAWCAASLIGMSALAWLGERRPSRRWAAAVFALSMLALLSIALPAGAVVRTALLRSSGAVAAPFVAQGWARFQSGHADPNALRAAWFKSRRGVPAIPPQRLPGQATAPIVILLTLDAVRADIVQLEEHRAAVPNLRAMAKRSTDFRRAWSPTSCTGPTLKQLFLGTYYSQHVKGINPGPYLPALLERAGVHTTHLLTHDVLKRGKGIGEGFGVERGIGERAVSEKVVAKVVAELDEDATGPRFIYSHILDAHAPYNRGGKMRDRKKAYIAEVSIVDAAIGTLRAAIAERKLTDRTYLIATADHGEAFMEHGRKFHAKTMYEEMIRVPLLIEGPGVKPRRVTRPVTLLDLSPTILDLFELPTPGHFMGESLIPFLRGETPKLSRPVAADAHNQIRVMLFDERMKAIIDYKSGTEELYDLKEDPEEKRNLAERADAAGYFATLREFFANLDKPQQ